MYKTVNLSVARRSLPQITDDAYAGDSITVARRGRELAVLIGVNEYRRLKEIEMEQRQQDLEILLAPPDSSALSEDEARKLAVEEVRKIRAGQS